MSVGDRTLKAQNLPWIAAYLVVHVVVAYALAIDQPLEDLGFKTVVDGVISENGALAFGALLLATILNGVLPPSAKAVIVFWRVRHTLPGHRAFSRVAVRDPRVDLAGLERRVGNLPSDPEV